MSIDADVVWDRYPVVLDTDNNVVRIEREGLVEEDWHDVEIVPMPRGQWTVNNVPDIGTVIVSEQGGCRCSGPSKTDTRGRAIP